MNFIVDNQKDVLGFLLNVTGNNLLSRTGDCKQRVLGMRNVTI